MQKTIMNTNIRVKAKVGTGGVFFHSRRWRSCHFLALVTAVVSGALGYPADVWAQRGGSIGQEGHDPTMQALSTDDWQQILNDARLRRSGNHYLAQGCDDPLQVSMETVDLNSDGQPEVVLTVSGSPCFSGLMHSNVSVYVRSSRGRWRDVLGFIPAFGVRVQPTSTKGYADLALTVLGGCDPVYRWAGASYIYATQLSAYGRECRPSAP